MAFQCCPAAFVTSRPSRPIWITKKKQKQAVKFVARFQLILRRKFCLFKIIAAIFLFGDFHFQLRMNESVLGGNSLKDNCHRHVDPHDLQIIFFPTRKRNDGNLSRKRRFLIGRRRHKQKYFLDPLVGSFKCQVQVCAYLLTSFSIVNENSKFYVTFD